MKKQGRLWMTGLYETVFSTRSALKPNEEFLGAFAKFVMSLRPSVRVEQLGSHWTDFYEIWYLSIFRNSVEVVQVSLKSDKNNGYCTWRPLDIFHHISLSFP
jgi:hypothetical protein